MIIYHASRREFLEDADANRLLPKLQKAFLEKTRSVPADHYVWADEYSRFAMALRAADISDSVEIAIEYHLSAAGRFRVDVLLAGNNGTVDSCVLIELKAWAAAQFSDVSDLVEVSYSGRRFREHPCVQAKKYKGLILRFNEDFRQGGFDLQAAAYLFNLQRRNPEPLEDARYEQALAAARLFLAQDVSQLRDFLKSHVPAGPKQDVLSILERGRQSPTAELASRVSSMLEGNEEFELIDEQNVAFQVIRHQIARRSTTGRHVFVVEGGPGTGKSVVAVRLLAEILRERRMGFMVAPNRAFRETIVQHLAKGNRGYREDGEAILRSSWNFHQVTYEDERGIDVLVVDESHRLKNKAHMYKGKNMVEDMVRAARVTVFFLDETQRVSWSDIGSVETIRAAAEKYGAKFHDPFQLTAQYRCNGSTGYLNWLDDVLGIRETANFDNWGSGQYEFKVFDTAEELYEALKLKNERNKARIVAGYAWEWPKKGRNRANPNRHVTLGQLSLPWNFDGENWATAVDGIEQVGCVHTSQGVEFDWLGVLIGPDLTYRNGTVVGDPAKRARTDSSLKGWKKELKEAKTNEEKQRVLEKVQRIIRSTYKVLLSRGRYGCYVWCADPDLRDYLRQRAAEAVRPEESSAQTVDPKHARPSIWSPG